MGLVFETSVLGWNTGVSKTRPQPPNPLVLVGNVLITDPVPFDAGPATANSGRSDDVSIIRLWTPD